MIGSVSLSAAKNLKKDVQHQTYGHSMVASVMDERTLSMNSGGETWTSQVKHKYQPDSEPSHRRTQGHYSQAT